MTGALLGILTGVPNQGALHTFWINLSFLYTGPMSEGEKSDPPSRAHMLGKAKYIQEVAWYPIVCC
jgi:hypothetical protein